MTDQNSGASHIYNERARQVVLEGYDADHDKGHFIEILDAAIGYAAFTSAMLEVDKAVSLGHHERQEAEDFKAEAAKMVPPNWPWGSSYWKPSATDMKRNLVKAGALIAAAIDSLEASGQFADDQDTLFELGALHADPVPAGLEGAILDPQELFFRALSGDEDAQAGIRAAAEQHGVHLAFTPQQLMREMEERGKEIPEEVRRALENLSEDGAVLNLSAHAGEPVHVVGLDVEDLPKASTSELLGYSEEDAALDAQLDRDVDLVVSVLRDQTGWLDWDGLEQRTHIPAPRLNDAIDLLVSQGVIQRDVNRFRLEG